MKENNERNSKQKGYNIEAYPIEVETAYNADQSNGKVIVTGKELNRKIRMIERKYCTKKCPNGKHRIEGQTILVLAEEDQLCILLQDQRGK